ncbi:multidrug transporter [Kribbella sp. DT2]|uniref:multidrug transporter n=1 Tax=Kribbella sp. DT2 TaxID=3393427 RepID=UPI003CF5F9D2
MRSLAVLEIVNIALIGWFVFFALDAPRTVGNVAGYAATAILLVVGASYWTVKLGQVRAGLSRLPRADTFRRLRVLCALVVVAAAVLVASALTSPLSEYVAGVVLLLLAAAEYVNYFHWQLMYDNRADLSRLFRTGRLARAHLWRDLRR